jgi:hypothetical protein
MTNEENREYLMWFKNQVVTLIGVLGVTPNLAAVGLIEIALCLLDSTEQAKRALTAALKDIEDESYQARWAIDHNHIQEELKEIRESKGSNDNGKG